MLVYANTLNIPHSSASLEAILRAVDSWLLFKTRNTLKASNSVNKPPVRLKDGKELEIIVTGTEYPGAKLLGSIVLGHPDGNVSGRKWFTRIGFCIPSDDAPTLVTVVLETSDISVQSGSSPVFATRPGVVRTIVEQCGLAFPSPQAKVEELNPETAEAFLADLERYDRDYAIVLMTREPFSERYYVSPADMLNQVASLARVVTIPNKAHTRSISELIGSRLCAWGGAINLIMPPLRSGFVPNRLIKPEQLRYETGRDKDPARYVLYLLTHRLNLLHFRREITVAAVRQHGLALRLDALKAEQRSIHQLEEMLLLLQSQQQQQQAEVERLKDENARAWAEWEEADERASEVTRLRNQISTYREAFKTLKKDGRLGSDEPTPITTVAEAIDSARRRFPMQLSFSLNSKSDGEESPYQAPEEVLKAFEWLATTYYDSRTAGGRCADLDRSLGEAIGGWHYSAHQKESTMKALKEWYQCPWEASETGKIWIPEHLKGGATRSRRPEESIRIAFAWEPDAKKVVIGFIGQHQENTKS